MLTAAGTLAAPFPYFGGKSLACSAVWSALGDPTNYVEPFVGSAAVLLGRPTIGKVETINDADGNIANLWRAVSKAADEVARHVDWPVNETDLFARHSWLVRNAPDLLRKLEADPEYFDAKAAGWWCWGACNWIGSEWCNGNGPWVYDGTQIVDRRTLSAPNDAEAGIKRQLPHLNFGRGINRKLPHLGDAGKGVNRQLPGNGNGEQMSRSEFIHEWFNKLMTRMRGVRVTAGDWRRVLNDSVTIRHGLTGVFLDPPYTNGDMDYAVGGVGGEIATAVRNWCAERGNDPRLRIVLCGHAGEHDALLSYGWNTRRWKAIRGYAKREEARANRDSETLWCSPHCVHDRLQDDLFL